MSTRRDFFETTVGVVAGTASAGGNARAVSNIPIVNQDPIRLDAACDGRFQARSMGTGFDLNGNCRG